MNFKITNMNINKYFESKEVTIEDLKKNFVIVKEYDIDMHHTEGCPHCKDKCNQHRKPSQSWTGVTWCIGCDSIIATIFSDRMGGVHTDTVLVFQDPEKKAYRTYWKCPEGPLGGPYTREGYNAILCLECNTESKDPEDIEKLFCKTCNKSLDYSINEKFKK